jgi:hypothetical protein
MPLDPDAYTHVQQVLGSWRLAAVDITQRLASGEVDAQDLFAVPGKGIEIKPLTAEDWKGVVANADADGMWFPGYWPLHGHSIFLRRADVYRIWPKHTETGAPEALIPLPARRPEDIPLLVWDVMKAIVRTRRPGDNQGALLEKVRGEVRPGISPRTLTTALGKLRSGRHIDF